MYCNLSKWCKCSDETLFSLPSPQHKGGSYWLPGNHASLDLSYELSVLHLHLSSVDQTLEFAYRRLIASSQVIYCAQPDHCKIKVKIATNIPIDNV